MKPNPAEARRMSNGSMWTINQNAESEPTSPKEESFMKKIKATFDLDLLKNSTYLNVALGCSLFYVAESNFKLMTPFFLSDIGEMILSSFDVISTVAKDVYYLVVERTPVCSKRRKRRKLHASHTS